MPPVYPSLEDRKIAENFVKNGTHNSHLIVRTNILLVLDRTDKKDHTRIKKTQKNMVYQDKQYTTLLRAITIQRILQNFYLAKNGNASRCAKD